MKRFTLPRTGIAAAASVLSLALATGCSDSGSDSGDGDKATGGKESTAAAKALSSGELEKAIIATGDVDGYEVSIGHGLRAVRVLQGEGQGRRREVRADRVRPHRVRARRLRGRVPQPPGHTGHRRDQAQRDLLGSLEDLARAPRGFITDALSSTMTIVSLSSYEGDGAQKTLASVSEAVEGCASGFTVAAGATPRSSRRWRPRRRPEAATNRSRSR